MLFRLVAESRCDLGSFYQHDLSPDGVCMRLGFMVALSSVFMRTALYLRTSPK